MFTPVNKFTIKANQEFATLVPVPENQVSRRQIFIYEDEIFNQSQEEEQVRL